LSHILVSDCHYTFFAFAQELGDPRGMWANQNPKAISGLPYL
jgi:hypothetical protein